MSRKIVQGSRAGELNMQPSHEAARVPGMAKVEPFVGAVVSLGKFIFRLRLALQLVTASTFHCG